MIRGDIRSTSFFDPVRIWPPSADVICNINVLPRAADWDIRTFIVSVDTTCIEDNGLIGVCVHSGVSRPQVPMIEARFDLPTSCL